MKGMIPKKEEVLDRARELYVQDCYRNGCPELANTIPENDELCESGFYSAALSSLMTNTETKNAEWLDSSKDAETSAFQFDTKEGMATTTFISGSRGVGKSDAAMEISDQLMKEDILVVVFDPSTDWIKRSGIREYLTVQPHSDLIVSNESIVFDISRLTPFEQQWVIENFAAKLFEFQLSSAKRFYVIFEECQTFFPLHAMQSKNFQNSMRLLCVGRNVNVSICAISQFPALVSKELIKHAGQSFLGFCAEPNTLKYWHGLIGKYSEKLRQLSNGQFVYYCRNKISLTEITPYESQNTKTQIVIPQSAPALEQVKPKEETTIVPFLKLAMLFCFAILLLRAMML